MHLPPLPHPYHPIRIRLLSLPSLISKMSTTPPPPPTFPTTPYTPATPHHPFPHPPSSFHRADESPDTDFYATPRFVTHIDEHAIALLKTYYAATLPRQGRILDLCSSWVSHFPPALHEAAVAAKKRQAHGGPINTSGPSSEQKQAQEREEQEEQEQEEQEQEEQEQEAKEDATTLTVLGLGLNAPELAANPILSTLLLQNLNTSPTLPASLFPLSATVCVVSIDYLTQPLQVLSSLRERTVEGGSVHLVVSNRCFPTKVVERWLRIGEEERLRMVGDYLWWSGWRGVEIVEVCDGRGRGGGLMGVFGGVDPLWVVRAVKGGEEGGGGEREKSGV